MTPIDYEKVQRKLDAILSKNLESITDKQIYIYPLGTEYTPTDLQNWINKRITILQNIKTMTQASQVQLAISTLNAQLCSSCKELVNVFPAPINKVCSQDYNRLIAIWLYQFAIGVGS